MEFELRRCLMICSASNKVTDLLPYKSWRRYTALFMKLPRETFPSSEELLLFFFWDVEIIISYAIELMAAVESIRIHNAALQKEFSKDHFWRNKNILPP